MVQFPSTAVIVAALLVIGRVAMSDPAHADMDILTQIAQCESRTGQFYPNGKVVRNGPYIGAYQIDLGLYGPDARRRGIKLETARGNREYALILARGPGGLNNWPNCSKKRAGRG